MADGSAAPAWAPAWAAHVPPGMAPADVDLAAGGSLPGAFTRSWAAWPGRVALSTMDGDRVTAEELEERTGRAALRLAGAGLAPGDRLLLCAATSVDMVVAYLGALRAGLTVVPANAGYTATELTALAQASSPALAVLDDPSLLPSPACPVTGTDLAALPVRGSGLVLDAAALEDTALIIYTSGTTGQPKGVPLTHRNLLASAHAVRLAWRWTPEDTLALCLPLFHVHGLGVGLHGTLVAGGGAILGGFSPSFVASAIDAGASMLFGVPTMYHRLAASAELPALADLRLAVSGSAPLPAELHEAIRTGSGQVVLERYGMTETIMLVSNPYDGERRPGTVGLPLPGVELRLAPRDGGAAEIEVRGPNVIDGYLGNPVATAAGFTADGWFRTGDLGILSDDGYLTISGRAKELIITGGYNVYPREIEELLRTHAGVADVAIVGAPSAQWGETVVAFVVPTGSAGPSGDLVSELDSWCAERLVAYKRPRVWRLVDSIPRNALGKILRHQLVP